MKLQLDYRLYPEDFWRVEQTQWDKATLSDLDTLLFRGDLLFRCSEARFDHADVPILGFAYEFSESLLTMVAEGRSRVEYCLLEWNHYLDLIRIGDEKILLSSNYTERAAEVEVALLLQSTRRFNAILLEEITFRFPFLQQVTPFKQIQAALQAV